MTTSLFIDGAVGTTGLEIRERLSGRRDLTLLTLPEDRRRDASARAEMLNAADVVILCLPDDAAREAVALIENPATRVIDASTAHRTDPNWTYGFPELEPDLRQRLARSKRVSNPGCWPTGFLALVRPLVREGLIAATERLTLNGASGYSGGGKAMIAEFEDGGTETGFRLYGLSLAHKHIPEMRDHAGLVHAPLFAPAVARAYRGMIVEVPLARDQLGGDAAQVHAALADAYAGSALIRVAAPAEAGAIATLPIERCAGSDRIELFVFANDGTGQIRLVAALDNLGKGAAGAAVQNLNIVAGLPEIEGLKLSLNQPPVLLRY